jgi:acyl-CoA-binding protein
MKTVIFCCDAFTINLGDAGNRGFSTIPVSYLESYAFFLQARNKDYIDKDKPGFFAGQTSISYCPWCGCKLSDLVEKFKNEISELAEKNNYLLLK